MSSDKMMYVHPAPVRVWHWINAVGFIVLILTGVQIRFAEVLNLFSLEEAIKIHNYVGFVVIAAYGLWVAFYFGTGKLYSGNVLVNEHILVSGFFIPNINVFLHLTKKPLIDKIY